MAQLVKNMHAYTGDTRDMRSIPGWGRSLEKEMATHSSILAWETPWPEEPGGLQSMELQRVRLSGMHTHAYTHTHTHPHTASDQILESSCP